MRPTACCKPGARPGRPFRAGRRRATGGSNIRLRPIALDARRGRGIPHFDLSPARNWITQFSLSWATSNTLALSCGRFWRGSWLCTNRDRADCQLERLVRLPARFHFSSAGWSVSQHFMMYSTTVLIPLQPAPSQSTERSANLDGSGKCSWPVPQNTIMSLSTWTSISTPLSSS